MRKKTRATPVMFVYWGRRGLSRFVIEAAREAVANPAIDLTISVSRQNESFSAFAEFGSRLVPVDTFSTNLGALGQAWRIPLLRQRIAREIGIRHIEAVIEFLPHVWSSFVFPTIRSGGVRYAPIIHDAETHPGDYRSFSAQRLIDRSMAQADVVLTLSEAVAGRLAASGSVPRAKLVSLFHPDLDFGVRDACPAPRAGDPIRLAFLGRIMPYKGLPLFLDAIDLLRAEGVPVSVGVFGEGALGESAPRLASMGAEVINRWLTEQEIGAILPRYHALVLSHIEASQSGVAATAFGAGLPVVATPAGGLLEQVQDGINGVIATHVGASELRDAVKRLLLDEELFDIVCRNIAASRGRRSMPRFVNECVSHALHVGPVDFLNDQAFE
ncbi:glycosyltransferase family 4 protein [Bradyrhizobium liaoningense]|uniref:glycosyltransferase family 4 protein n=1 Tax=Bradyrhizobium liaoningense TaxID=43992 RepID=UPI001BAC617B|nr:glycosyltransferase family 4 protein [Bradyrhizobium liaoningense]MBR0843877.1 glycosyltransferase family 4 protein [Bradyrhizobium liaoningense]